METEEYRIRAGVQEHRHPGKFKGWHPVSQKHRRTPLLRLTIRERAGGVLYIEIPQSHKNQGKFPTGTSVIIALAGDNAIWVPATVWGTKRRFATIKKKQENSDRFTVDTDVTVRLDKGVE